MNPILKGASDLAAFFREGGGTNPILMKGILLGAGIGFAASTLIFAIPLLADPGIFKEDFDLGFVLGTLFCSGVSVGLFVGVPIGALLGGLSYSRKSKTGVPSL